TAVAINESSNGEAPNEFISHVASMWWAATQNILVTDYREHFALLSVRLEPPRDDLQTGSVRRTPTFDGSSIDANDHLLGRFIRFSILGNFPLNLFVDALPNRVDPASGGGMGSSAHRWEEHSQQSRSLAIRNLRSQAHLEMTQLGRHSPREDFRNRAPNLCGGILVKTPRFFPVPI